MKPQPTLARLQSPAGPYRAAVGNARGVVEPFPLASRRIRLLIVHVDMYSGGVETQLLSLLRGLDPARYEIHLGLGRAVGDRLQEVPNYVELHELGSRPGPRLTAALVPRIAGLVRMVNPHLCVSFHPFLNVETFIGARLAAGRLPVVGSFAGHASTGRLDFIRRPAIRRMNCLCCASSSVAASVARVYGRREGIAVIPNCADADLVESLAGVPVEHRWLADKDLPVLATVGRLIPTKGIDFLIRSVVFLNRTHRARCLIVGDGPERPRLERLVRESGATRYIELVGYQQNPHRFVARSDVFIFGSLSEGLPTVLIEAMICGTPVVTTEFLGGLTEIIEDGVTGLIVRPRTEEAMAKAVLSVLASPGLRSRLRQSGRRRATEEFGVQRYVRDYSLLFDALASG